ncbi:fungal hydrophobin-domain-containing protein [Boletus edulis BED1]|uniref:Hydrophobin n=1 Tax=Boletus edulis BED1 TaxID=1328754 RepID=A0AAD4BRH1_BOLED|nr:fungal hydrophobin-domain-containing protein [Boletus edulis BED1]
MFARFVTIAPLVALAAVAAAAPNALEARTGGSTCNSGSVYCCNQEFSNTSSFGGGLLGLLGLLNGIGVNAGIACTPITIIGALSNGAQCTQQTACCSNVNQNGLVNIACTPIAIPV